MISVTSSIRGFYRVAAGKRSKEGCGLFRRGHDRLVSGDVDPAGRVGAEGVAAAGGAEFPDPAVPREDGGAVAREDFPVHEAGGLGGIGGLEDAVDGVVGDEDGAADDDVVHGVFAVALEEEQPARARAAAERAAMRNMVRVSKKQGLWGSSLF